MATDLLSSSDTNSSLNDISTPYKLFHKTNSIVTLLIDVNFLNKHPDWSSDPNKWNNNLIQVIIPTLAPDICLICEATNKQSELPNVIAAQFDLSNYEIPKACQIINNNLDEWINDYMSKQMSSTTYDNKISKQVNVQKPFVPIPPNQPNNLNLYNLLVKLGEPSVTTVEQRIAIKQVITDFLNNEISSSKLFVYLNHVLGYNILENIISSLSEDEKSSTPAKISTKLNDECIEKEDLRQRTRILRSVYTNLKWIHLRNFLYCNTYGHKLCSFHSNCLIFGGHFFKEITLEKDMFPTFERIRQINQNSLTSSIIDTSPVNCPPSLAHHSAAISLYDKFPYTFIYGGFQVVDSKSISLNSHLYGLNLTTHSWSIIDKTSKIRPPPRHSHAGTSYPYNKSAYNVLKEIEFLIIYGGVGAPVENMQQNQSPMLNINVLYLKILSDLWLFDFKNLQWIQIQLNIYPSARFGLDFLYISSNVLVLYGGEFIQTSNNSSESLNETSSDDEASKITSKQVTLGVPPGKQTLLGDTWLLVLNKIRNVNELFSVSWQFLTEEGPKRAHYAAIALTTPIEGNILQMQNATPYLQQSTVKQPNCKQPSDNFYRVNFYISGLAQNADGVISETPSIMIGLFNVQDYLKVSVQFRIITLDNTLLDASSFQGRRGHSAVFFQAPAESPEKIAMRNLLAKQKLLLNSENTKIKDKPLNKECDTEKLQNYSENIEANENIVKKNDFIKEELDSKEDDIYNLDTNCKLSKLQTTVPCILVCGGTWGEKGLINDIQILSLSSIYPQFMTNKEPPPTSSYDFEDEYENNSILDNAIIQKISTYSPQHYSPLYQTGLSIPAGLLWSLSTFVKHPFTAIAHLTENALDILVKARNISVSLEMWNNTQIIQVMNDQVGLSYQNLHILLKRFGQSSEYLTRNDNNRYGLGFKLGVGRLSHNALVITKSSTLLGVGLFSSHLNSILGSNIFVCPITCWSLVNGLPIVDAVEEAGFAQSLQLILLYSPLKTKEALKQEFKKFDTATGTRIILFDLRKDMPCFHVSEKHDLCVHSSKQNNSTDLKIDSLSIQISELYNGISISPISTVKLPSTFPLFTDAANSMDYNASTYLYWAHLHSNAKMFLNGTELKVPETVLDENDTNDSEKTLDSSEANQVSKSENFQVKLPSNDEYKNSLWRYLQNNLYNKLEFPFLIDPQYGEKNFYGIIGFLNNRKANKPLVCETGVLLYYKGRFITRCIMGFPLLPKYFKVESDFQPIDPECYTLSSLNVTAVINMPDFFAPRADKEGFIFESDTAMQDVYNKLEKAIKEYLAVCEHPDELEQLQTRYISEFDLFREKQWNERKHSYAIRPHELSPQSQTHVTDADFSNEMINPQDVTQTSENEFLNSKAKRRRKVKEDDNKILRRRRRARYRNKKGEDDTDEMSIKQSQSDDDIET